MNRTARILCSLVLIGWGAVDANAAERRPNVLFIAIDDLRSDLGTMGASHAKTPQLDAFAKTARVFPRHYAQVPTCGASRAALLRGRYPSTPAHVGNGAIKSTHADWGDANLPALFQRYGYQTFAPGKITHYPGGLTGKLWAEGAEELPGAWTKCWIPQTPWGEAERLMHGYANGRARAAGKTLPWESVGGSDKSYPDAWIADEAVETLRQLAPADEPWFFAVGFFKPHLPFAAPKKWWDLHELSETPRLSPDVAAKPGWPSAWHASGEFRKNYGHDGRDPATDPAYAQLLRQGYAACVSYTDAQVGRVLDALKELGLAENTIVVVWGDHGFLLGEHAIWGKHCLYEEALRTPLLIRAPRLREPGASSHAIVETVDLFPTLTDLCTIPTPPGLDGQSLRPQLESPAASSYKPALGFWEKGQQTIRTDRWRLIVQSGRGSEEPVVELFDYETDRDETRNHASEQPQVVKELLARLRPAP